MSEENEKPAEADQPAEKKENSSASTSGVKDRLFEKLEEFAPHPREDQNVRANRGLIDSLK